MTTRPLSLIVAVLALLGLPPQAALARIHNVAYECTAQGPRHAPRRETTVVVANPNNVAITITLRSTPSQRLGEPDGITPTRVPVRLPAKGSLELDCEAIRDLQPPSASSASTGTLFVRTYYESDIDARPDVEVTARYVAIIGGEFVQQMVIVPGRDFARGPLPNLEARLSCIDDPSSTLRVTVTNSQRAASTTTAIAVLIEDAAPVFRELPPIPAGGRVTLDVDYASICSLEQCRVTVSVDPTNAVEESDESNNFTDTVCATQ